MDGHSCVEPYDSLVPSRWASSPGGGDCGASPIWCCCGMRCLRGRMCVSAGSQGSVLPALRCIPRYRAMIVASGNALRPCAKTLSSTVNSTAPVRSAASSNSKETVFWFRLKYSSSTATSAKIIVPMHFGPYQQIHA
jgi:hypothetical protein